MNNNSAWILVEVRSGIPLSVKAFANRNLAEIEETKIRENLNLENDETGIFQIEIPREETNAYIASN